MNPLFWDWKSHFGNNVRSIKNLCGFRAFMVKCDSLGQPGLFYKKYILELTWLGFKGSLSQDLLLISIIYNNFRNSTIN
jgi:hypothetical protein